MKKYYHFLHSLASVALAIVLLSACDGKEDPGPEDPCATTDLAVSATSEGLAITAAATGGESPYTFSLDGGAAQSSGTFTDLEAGTYTVTVQDANACTATDEVEVVDPCANFSVEAIGSAYDVTLAITSGTAPFSYSYSNGNEEIEAESSERSFTLTMAAAENTTFTITDANDCEVTVEVSAEALISFTDDRDGQTYEVVKIGDQIWFAENFNYDTEEGSYCYDNEEANCDTYGKLYTWDVAQTVAPEGWRLPSEADYQTLINTTGGGETAAAALVVGGASGFEFQMAGKFYGEYDEFADQTSTGFGWTSSSTNESEAVALAIVDAVSLIELNETLDKVDGLSVRFIKN